MRMDFFSAQGLEQFDKTYIGPTEKANTLKSEPKKATSQKEPPKEADAHIHTEDLKSSLSEGSLWKHGHDQVQTETAFCDSITTFNDDTLTVVLGFELTVTIRVYNRPSEFGTGEANAMFLAKSQVVSIPVNLIGLNNFGIATVQRSESFHAFNQRDPFVEVIEALPFDKRVSRLYQAYQRGLRPCDCLDDEPV